MSLENIGKYIEEFSRKNKNNEPYPVYSVTNSNGFCTDYFNKDVSGQDKTTYKIVPRGYFAYNPSRINVGSIDWQNIDDNQQESWYSCLREHQRACSSSGD